MLTKLERLKSLFTPVGNGLSFDSSPKQWIYSKGGECIYSFQLQTGCLLESSTCENYKEYVQDLQSKLKQIFQLVREKNICRMKCEYDTPIRQHNYQTLSWFNQDCINQDRRMLQTY